MRKWIIGIIVVALVASGVYIAIGRAGVGAGSPQPTPQASGAPAVKAGDQVVADARVVPVQSVALNFPTSGIVAEVLVKEGDTIRKDAPLLRLDDRDLKLQIEQAQASLSQAQAGYDKLRAGAAPEEIAMAQAQVNQAQAQLRQTSGSVTQQDILAAQAQLDQARAALALLRAGPKSADLQAAQAALDQARASLQAQRDSLSAAKTRAQSEMEQAANLLRDRQADYDRVYWDNRRLEQQLARFNQELPQANKDQEAAALRAVRNAEESLNQARLGYEQAQQAEMTGIDAAEAQVRSAQASLDKLLAGTDADRVAAARAQVAQAEANLSKLRGDQRGGSVDAAAAGLANAQANLERLTTTPRTVDLANALAQVQVAQVALKQAELALDQATLSAPIGGTVVEVNLKVGEAAGLGKAAIVLADLSGWKIETTDLTELSVVHIHEGDPVAITFDALPGLEMPGKVTSIKALGENKQGDITYTVTIASDTQDARLRWNMTASVSIAPRK
jgi:HlyD family secretion protein